jgi:hypothetical protein
MPEIKRALSEFNPDQNIDIEQYSNATLCSSNALDCIQFFTSVKPGTKVRDAYDPPPVAVTANNSTGKKAKRQKT